jgi:hypothetical protein
MLMRTDQQEQKEHVVFHGAYSSSLLVDYLVAGLRGWARVSSKRARLLLKDGDWCTSLFYILPSQRAVWHLAFYAAMITAN